jgi:glycosyltransferase involved in cell wall biosynthesis
MQKTNLLYVVTKLELGGAQKQLLSLAICLDKARFNIFLFTSQNGLLVEEASSIKGVTLNKSRYLERPVNPLKDLLALIEIFRYIKKNNIQIVHTHSSKAGILGRLAARLAKAKIIIHTVHGWSFNDYQPFFVRRIFIALERLTAQFTHKLIVASYYDKEKGLKNRIGQEDRYKLIRYGIDYTEFLKTEQNLKEELGIGANDLVVGMIACFKPQKSPQDFIKAAFITSEKFPNVKFLLVGDGALRNRVKKLINKFNLQDKLILTGWRRDIPKILSTIDIFVLTSLWEGLPVSALEALVSSRPVVATNTGGIREIIFEGKNGFLVKSKDMEKLSERLTLLLKDDNLRRIMSQNAKGCFNLDFSKDNMVKNTQGLYEAFLWCRKV